MLKKILGFFITVLLLVSGSVCVFADDGLEYSAYYDFENYNGKYGSGTLPGDDWTLKFDNLNLKEFGSYYDEERESKCLQVGSSNRPTVWFGQTFKSGKVHITYYVKTDATGNGTGIMMYDARNGDEKKKLINNNYFMRPLVHRGDLVGYRQQWDDWYSVTKVFDNDNEWHRVDILTDELSNTTPGVAIYWDGALVNEKPLTSSVFTGLKALGFQSEGGTTYYDDILIKRFYGDNGFSGEVSGSERVSAEDGELNIKLRDTVNPDMIVKENVIIKNLNTGDAVENFLVEDVTEDSFKICFQGEIKRGIYSLILNDSVRTKILDLSMSEEVIFRTEYETKKVNRNFADESFDEYSDTDGTLPYGWLYFDNETENAVSVQDKAEGYALGFENVGSVSNPIKAVMPYEFEIPAGLEFDLSFDVYNENMSWYLYSYNDEISEEGGVSENTVMIAQTNAKGNLYYSNDGKTTTRIHKDFILTPGKWHNVKVKVKPEKANTTTYIITIDDTDAKEIEVARDYYNIKTSGIGIGYLPQGEENKLYIDNLKVSADVEAYVPEIEELNVIDAGGNVIDMFTNSVSLTSQIQRIDVLMNTAIDENNILESIVFAQNGEPLDYYYETEKIDGSSKISLHFDTLLEPGCEYKISAVNVQSAFSDELVMDTKIEKVFITKEDASVKLIENNLDKENGKYTLIIAKNNNADVKYTVMVSGYKNKTVGNESYKKLETVEYMPVELMSGYEGIVYAEFDLKEFSECDEIKTFLWRYPNNEIIDTNNAQLD